MNTQTAICVQCEAEFARQYTWSKYCGDVCLKAAIKARVQARKPPKVTVVGMFTCENEKCNRTFERQNFLVAPRFCRERCRNAVYQREAVAELAALRRDMEKCSSCSLDYRRVRSGECACFLSGCPQRATPVDEKTLDQFARQLAYMGLGSNEQNDISVGKYRVPALRRN